MLWAAAAECGRGGVGAQPLAARACCPCSACGSGEWAGLQTRPHGGLPWSPTHGALPPPALVNACHGKTLDMPHGHDGSLGGLLADTVLGNARAGLPVSGDRVERVVKVAGVTQARG